MKLLMTTDTVGGVWTYSLELAWGLAASGVEVALATMGDAPTPAQRAAARSVPGLTLYASEYALEWMGDPWEDVRKAGDWLLRLEGEVRPDVIHLNGYAHGALPWSAPVLAAGHSCVLSWWDAVKGAPAGGEWNRYRREVRRGLAGADLVVAPSRAMLAALESHYGPLPASRVVPNGREPHLFAPAAKEPFILAAGRLWDEAKNVAALDAAAARLPWPVYVAGDTRHPAGGCLQPRNLACLGALAPAEVARWMGRASIYALPARYEPFGLSALEAALAGCALVLGDIPSLREVWGDAALFVPPGDSDALSAALAALIHAPERRAELALRAGGRAREYSVRRMVTGYLDAYDTLLSSRRAPQIHREEEPACVS